MLSIIIPTYNERENLMELIRRIHDSLANIQYEVIIVDDSSPDGTGELAEKLAKSYPIKVFHRKERGIGSARIFGLKHANNKLLGVMDADLQHPPEKIPEFLEKIRNHDIVIGKRIKEERSFNRRFISKGAIILAKILFPRIRKLSDITSGFFFLKKEVIDGLNLKPTSCEVLLEILIKGKYKKIAEIPYVLKERKYGESKLGLKEYLNYLKHIFKLSLEYEKNK